jgi:hypothetical protein
MPQCCCTLCYGLRLAVILAGLCQQSLSKALMVSTAQADDMHRMHSHVAVLLHTTCATQVAGLNRLMSYFQPLGLAMSASSTEQ